MTKVKALSVLQCRDYVLQRHGEDGLTRVKAAMDPVASSAIYSHELLPTDWVEIAYAVDHARAFDRCYGAGDGRLASQMIADLATHHVGGLYRSLLAGGSPRIVLERASRLWNRYYDQGETQLEWIGERAAIKRILGCPDLPRHHDLLTTSYYEVLLKHSNAIDIVIKHTRCVALGADCCETELRWNDALAQGQGFDL